MLLLGEWAVLNVRFDGHADQLGQFVGALQTCWNLHGPLPVIIVKALLKCEGHQCLLGHVRRVIGHSEQRGGACALRHVLGCQMEVIAVVLGQRLGENAS